MTPGAPTVYFIDDSATMREVIKIAFRRENISVIACHDANSALAQMDQVRPDVVISDVIMPEKDGYQVCEYIKQHPRLGRTPVILMSGVVNRAVAERAFAVKADELIRKPFQPQDLIARVKHLLNPRSAAAPPAAATSASAALSSIFAAPLNAMPMQRPTAAAARPAVDVAAAPPVPTAAAMRTAAATLTAASRPSPRPPVTPPAAATQPVDVPAPPTVPQRQATAPAAAKPATLDLQKLKIEVLRLQGLVRKLQSELEAEREYSRALEAHIKTLQEAE